MIKLFFITLLCAALVFADLPVQNFEDTWKQPVNGFLSMADHFMGRNLVRRSAQGPPGGPPGGGGSGGGSGHMGFGFNMGAGMGGGAGGGAGGKAGGGAGGEGGSQ